MQSGKLRRILVPGLFSLCLAGALFAAMSNSRQEGTSVENPIELAVRKNIRVVYQIKTDGWKDGIGAGLEYVRRILDQYRDMGIPLETVHLSAVFHGEAGYWMLKDPAYNRAAGVSDGNPNKQVIRELLGMGASLELCAQTMKHNGWTSEDVLPGVRIVVGAYARIIDLQLRDYAYIRF